MPEAQIREQAHRLIDFMALHQVSEIVGLMQTMLIPFERSLASAPLDDEPISPEEAHQVEAAHASLQHGEGIPHADILAEFGLTLADIEDLESPPVASGKSSNYG